jgi:hypothetical protein
MPKVKDIGLKKHLDSWESRKREEQARKDEIRRHKEKAALYNAKTKEKKAKSRLHKASHGNRKTAGKGISLSQMFGKRH